MAVITKKVKLGDFELVLETGKLAKQADGSATVRYGDTVLLATSVSAKDKKDIDFLPLTVEYKENFAAAGRIPGGYFRREGRLTEKETLTSRVVDRSCRPLFPEGYAYETQLIVNVISADRDNDPDVLALNGVSAALACSDIPFGGPVGCVRVGRLDGKFVLFPTYKQRETSDFDLIVAASKDAIVMVEGGASEVSEAEMVQALEFGHEACRKIVAVMEEMRAAVGAKTREYDKAAKFDPELKAKAKTLTWDGIKAGYQVNDKLDRYSALKAVSKGLQEKMKAELGDDVFAKKVGQIKAIFEELKYEYMREEQRKINRESTVLPLQPFQKVEPLPPLNQPPPKAPAPPAAAPAGSATTKPATAPADANAHPDASAPAPAADTGKTP